MGFALSLETTMNFMDYVLLLALSVEMTETAIQELHVSSFQEKKRKAPMGIKTTGYVETENTFVPAITDVMRTGYV